MLTLAVLLFVAQSTTVTNPRYAEFTPSANHSELQPVTGEPVLTNYELRIFLADGDTFVQPAVNLNKPIPDIATNKITVDIGDTILALPSGVYTTRIAAKGPGGENVSEKSNVFDVNKDLPLSPASLTIIK